MIGKEFKRSARLGCRVYGDDPWFFLRELAQNSRDAGASRMDVEASWERLSLEVVRVTDDGTGMSLEHARKYLFRLYSSSKENDPTAAGMYGIGFWSVLLFGPSHIVLESNTGAERWGISISPDFKLRQVDCHLDRRGTRVTLVRQARSSSQARFVADVRIAASRFCKHLRRNNRQADALPMYVQGHSVARPLELSGPVTLAFKEGKVEGVVGLAEEPRVELLARGLPVWNGLLLDELTHSASNNRWRSEIARGLSPVFVLNGNDLNVIMSRNAVVDDRALARVRRVASRSLNRLVQQHLQRTFPVSLSGTLAAWWERARQFVLGIRPLVWGLVGLSLVVFVTAWWAGTVFLPGGSAPDVPGVVAPSVEENESSVSFEEESATPSGLPPCGPDDMSCRQSARMLPGRYEGAVVNRARMHRAVDLSYAPPRNAWFKILTADTYKPGSGLLTDSGRLDAVLPAADYHCRQGCLRVTLNLPAKGRAVLPVPSGFMLVSDSVKVNRAGASPAGRNRAGEYLLDLPAGAVEVVYEVGPPAQFEDIPAHIFSALTAIPNSHAWPPEVDSIVSNALVLPVGERVLAAVRTARALVRYDRSNETVILYEAGPDSLDWLSFVLSVGRGDCDVINGLVAVILRRMNVPARLAVGLVGENGRVAPGLHAWTEYWDQGWHTVDASRPPASVARPAGESAGDAGAVMAPVPPTIALAGEEAVGNKAGSPEEQGNSGDAGSGRSLPSSRVRPAREDRGPAPRAEEQSDAQRLVPGESIAWWPLLIALLSALTGLWLLGLWVRGRGRQESSTLLVADSRFAQTLLAQMAVSALATPRAWRQVRAIWFHRILPTLGASRISISMAQRLSRKGRLFTGLPTTGLARAAAAAGAVVLDRSNEAFVPLVDTFSGAVNLDETAALEAAKHDPEESWGFEPLVGTLNRILSRCAVPVQCLTSTHLQQVDFRDVDLSGVPPAAELSLPRRFIVLNSDGPKVRAATELFGRMPQQGVFLLLDELVSRSLLLRTNGRRIRHKAAQMLLEESL